MERKFVKLTDPKRRGPTKPLGTTPIQELTSVSPEAEGEGKM